MSAIDLAAVILAVVALGAVAALTWLTVRLGRTVADLRRTVEHLEAVSLPAVADLSDAADGAARQVQRLDDLIRTTASVTDTVDTATQVTFRALANPVIKGVALASGTGRAAKRLRGGERPQGPTQRGA